MKRQTGRQLASERRNGRHVQKGSDSRKRTESLAPATKPSWRRPLHCIVLMQRNSAAGGREHIEVHGISYWSRKIRSRSSERAMEATPRWMPKRLLPAGYVTKKLHIYIASSSF